MAMSGRLVTLLTAVVVVATVGSNEFNEKAPSKCVPLLIELCRDMPYNLTRFPNLVQNDEQGEAELQLSTYAPLLHNHNDFKPLKFFLCSVLVLKHLVLVSYVPMCTEKVPQAIGPCRPLCEKVRRRCEPTLKHFGFPWPASLNCSKFPLENNAETMCMRGPQQDMDSDDPAELVEVDRFNPDDYNSVVTSRPFGTTPFNCRAQHGMSKGRTLLLPRTEQCALDCRTADQPFTTQQRRIATAIALSFAVISCLMGVLCVLALVCRTHTFCLRYPEACLLFLTLCIAVYAATCLVSMLYRTNVSCVDLDHLNERIYVGGGEQHVPCTVTAVIMYYFSTAARMWWLNLCWGWFMSAGLGWSPDKLYARRFPMHVLAWGVPLLAVVVVLMIKAVDADPLTAVCFVGQQNARNLLMFVAARDMLVVVCGGLALLLGLFTIRETSSASTHEKAASSAALTGGTNGVESSVVQFTNSPPYATNASLAGGGTQARTGVICSLYVLILCVCIVCYLVEWDSSRAFNVLLVRLVTDWCYGLVTQAWCAAWILFASFHAGRRLPPSKASYAPAIAAAQHHHHQQAGAGSSSNGYDRYTYVPAVPAPSATHMHHYYTPSAGGQPQQQQQHTPLFQPAGYPAYSHSR